MSSASALDWTAPLGLPANEAHTHLLVPLLELMRGTRPDTITPKGNLIGRPRVEVGLDAVDQISELTKQHARSLRKVQELGKLLVGQVGRRPASNPASRSGALTALRFRRIH